MSTSIETRTHASALLDRAARKIEEKLDEHSWLRIDPGSNLSDIAHAELQADRAAERLLLTQEARKRAICWTAYRLQAHNQVTPEEAITQAITHVKEVEELHAQQIDGLRKLYVDRQIVSLALPSLEEAAPQAE